MLSLVIPVYKNAGNIPDLLAALEQLNRTLNGELELVFVVDGSPDDSWLLLSQALPKAGFASRLLLLSRNFGSFSAIRAGLAAGRGERFAVMAADLQEPPELVAKFDAELRTGECDVVIGVRESRSDPLATRLSAQLFWALYRRFVQKEVPPGGVDVFGCTAAVRDELVALGETNSSLVGLLFWVGFRRRAVPYVRRERTIGKSAWTLDKKIRYLTDSVFSFTDLPVRLLFRLGVVGLALSVVWGSIVVGGKLLGVISVPGYAATALLVMFFGALNSLGLGVIGGYVWRTFENTKRRPNYIVASAREFSRDSGPGTPRPGTTT